MKILIDECLPDELKDPLTALGHCKRPSWTAGRFVKFVTARSPRRLPYCTYTLVLRIRDDSPARAEMLYSVHF